MTDHGDRLKLEVQLLEAKPNPMFPEWMTERLRFLRFSEAVACAECGKRSKHHWTMFCTFQAHSMAALAPIKSGKEHAPLTAVCRSHILAPQIIYGEKKA